MRDEDGPGLSVGRRGWPEPWLGVGREQAGDDEGQQSEGRQHQEESQPAPVVEERAAECSHQQIVDNVAGEEKPVDGPAVLVSEGLGGDGWLGGVGPGEREVNRPDGRGEGDLPTEGGDGQQSHQEGEADGLQGHGHLVAGLVHQEPVKETP